MTEMRAHGRTAGDQPNPHDDHEPNRNPQRNGDPGRGGRLRRPAGAIGYDGLLARVGVLRRGDGVMGKGEGAGRGGGPPARPLPPAPAAAATLPTPEVTAGSGRGRVFGYGLLS